MKSTFRFLLSCLLLCYSMPLYAFDINLTDYNVVTNDVVSVEGTVPGDYLKIAGSFVEVQQNNKFSAKVPVFSGLNLLSVAYMDAGGKIVTHNYTIKKVLASRDLPADFWAAPYISAMLNSELIDGFPGDVFMPTADITQADLLTWMVKIKRLPLPKVTENISMYLPASHWVCPYIKAAYDNQLITEDIKEFNPFTSISRSKAAMLVMSNFIPVKAKKNREDDLINDYLHFYKLPAPVKLAIEKNIIEGISDKIVMLDFSRPIIRAEAVKLLYYTEDVQRILKYDTEKQIIKIDSKPDIHKLKVYPISVEKTEEALITFKVNISDRIGLYNISYVYLILAGDKEGKKLLLMDNGDWGDKTPGDGEYTLQMYIPENFPEGKSKFTIVAGNYQGWQARRYSSFDVVKPKHLPPVFEKVTWDFHNDVLTVIATVSDKDNDIISVVGDFGDLSGSFKERFTKAADGTYVASLKVPLTVHKGNKVVMLKAVDARHLTKKYELAVKIK